MEITQVGNRGVLFTFDELNQEPFNCSTNVYVIIGHEHFIVCDAYLGKYYMSLVKEYLTGNYGNKNYIVFNSHSHWDHIWGNSEFDGHLIISHTKCRDLIELYGEEEVKAHADNFAKDKIEIVLPNLTFENKKTLDEENIEFFHSPGHSEDSSSCFDKEDGTLFVGDNVDDPIPSFMSWNNLDKYIETLQKYLEIDAQRIVQSHGPVIDNSVVKLNAEYLAKLKSGEKIEFNQSDNKKTHRYNLSVLNT
ncbi:MAG: MBL fold metallo-hydrolase [Desulfobacteraceae bacterium]|nr:MBL fold metallo-hydrolase [Desulfobacteraceae bacterium]